MLQTTKPVLIGFLSHATGKPIKPGLCPKKHSKGLLFPLSSTGIKQILAWLKKKLPHVSLKQLKWLWHMDEKWHLISGLDPELVKMGGHDMTAFDAGI